MRLFYSLPLALAPLASALATTSLIFTVPVNQILQNPWALPANTHITLSTLHKTLSAPISTTNAFAFHNVTPGSYLVDVHCATYVFAPLRLDVLEDLGLVAWETYRGNDWDNKGEALQPREAGGLKTFELHVLGAKNYFYDRPKFSVLTILKNPMILLGLLSMGLFVGMPYLIDTMDPEMKAEFEERQKNSAVNSILSGQQGGGNPMGNFDMAAFLAGSSKKDGGAGNGSKKDKGSAKR